MELKQLKNILWQIDFGQFFENSMVCSIPIPVKTTEGMHECCFWCRYDWEKNVFSGPVVRLSYNAERKKCISFVFCKGGHFFSAAPNEIIHAKKTAGERAEKYPKFEEMYNLARPVFYKENCTDGEKQLLSEFYRSFKDYVDESLMVFYRELVPSFFEWLERETITSE